MLCLPSFSCAVAVDFIQIHSHSNFKADVILTDNMSTMENSITASVRIPSYYLCSSSSVLHLDSFIANLTDVCAFDHRSNRRSCLGDPSAI